MASFLHRYRLFTKFSQQRVVRSVGRLAGLNWLTGSLLVQPKSFETKKAICHRGSNFTEPRHLRRRGNELQRMPLWTLLVPHFKGIQHPYNDSYQSLGCIQNSATRRVPCVETELDVQRCVASIPYQSHGYIQWRNSV